MQFKCSKCQEFTEMNLIGSKWSGRTVYQCSKCHTKYLKCRACSDGMAKVGNIYDDFYCPECKIKESGKNIGKVAIWMGMVFIRIRIPRGPIHKL